MHTIITAFREMIPQRPPIQKSPAEIRQDYLNLQTLSPEEKREKCSAILVKYMWVYLRFSPIDVRHAFAMTPGCIESIKSQMVQIDSTPFITHKYFNVNFVYFPFLTEPQPMLIFSEQFCTVCLGCKEPHMSESKAYIFNVNMKTNRSQPLNFKYEITCSSDKITLP